MAKYIALLRGINVGGKNIIPMAGLKAAFMTLGFLDVRTYINSGNVIFSSEIGDEGELKELCERVIWDEFALEIPVAIISAADLREALGHAPGWWGASGGSKHNALFVLRPATPQSILEQIGELNPEHEQVGWHGQVLFWSAPMKTFSRTRLLRIVGTAAYQCVTIRNSNTAKKLLELVKESL